MAEDFRDIIAPIGGTPPIEGLEGGSGAAPPFPRSRRTIPGKVVSVRRATAKRDGEHTLDVTVGGEEYAEIVLRVAPGAYLNLEGRNATLYVEE